MTGAIVEKRMNAREVADILNIGVESVRRAAQRGRIPFQWRLGPFGPERVFDAAAIDAYRERRDAKWAALIGNDSMRGTHRGDR